MESDKNFLRCTLCKTAAAAMRCDVCHIDLCQDCVEHHLSGQSNVHKVILQKHCLEYPKRKTHKQHSIVDALKNYQEERVVLRRDLQELSDSIYPKYQEALLNIHIQKLQVSKHSQKLTKDLNEQGKALHTKIDTIIKRMQSEVDEKDSQIMEKLEKYEDEIKHSINKINQAIVDLQKLLDSSDASVVSQYKSKIENFRKLPSLPDVRYFLPNFKRHQINEEQLMKLFGSLSPSLIETQEEDNTLSSHGAESTQQDRSLLYFPRLITVLDTEYEYLYGVSCLSNKEIWTHGGEEIMKLYNLHGEIVKSVVTKSGSWPEDMVLTLTGDLVYTDYWGGSINIVKNSQIKPLATPRGWKPLGVCVTSTGGLLVIMDNEEDEHTKVVRYSGSSEKQSIQLDDQGQPLYSTGGYKYITENRNLDICVSVCYAREVVVVSETGKLRYKYTGRFSTTKMSFRPRGITTDSQSNMLIADGNNHCIHIVDKEGHLLHFIDNCNLFAPWGLCVNSNDILFVAEYTGKIKEIQYYK